MNTGTELVRNIITKTARSALTGRPIHMEDNTLNLILALQNTSPPHAAIQHPETTLHTFPGSQIGLDLAHLSETVLQLSKNTVTEGKNDITASYIRECREC